MILKVRGISFKYKSKPVLENVHFEVGSGELLAILGPNGVGKTTLLKCLNAMFKPENGAVFVGDKNLYELSRKEIANNLAYVAQRSEVGRLTAFDAILLGRKPYIGWRVGKEDLKKVDAVIHTLKLEDLSLRFLDEMSGGELQKVSIARALVQEPQILLLDEPTSSLDLKNQQEVLKTIRNIVADHDISAVMTMHDINAALKFADKVLFMKDGGIVAASSKEDISAPLIEEVYDLPVEVVYLQEGNNKKMPVVLPV